MLPASHWRRKRPSAKTRSAVLDALRGVELSAFAVAGKTWTSWYRACAALDVLRIAGRVELVDGRFRRTEAS